MALDPTALKALVALATRRGPDALRVLAVVAPYLREPENRERFRTLTQRWQTSRTAKTPDARLTQQIAALVEHATAARAEADTDAERAQADAWLRRGRALERSRTLLLGTATRSKADAPRRRQAVERLTPEIERLRTEMLEAMLTLGHGPSSGEEQPG